MEWKEVDALARQLLKRAGVGHHADALLTVPHGPGDDLSAPRPPRPYKPVGAHGDGGDRGVKRGVATAPPSRRVRPRPGAPDEPASPAAEVEEVEPPLRLLPAEVWQNVGIYIFEPVRIIPLTPFERPLARLKAGFARRKVLAEAFFATVESQWQITEALLDPWFRAAMYRRWLQGPLEGVVPGRDYGSAANVWGEDDATSFELPRAPTPPFVLRGIELVSPKWFLLFLDTVFFNELFRMNACAVVRLQLADDGNWGGVQPSGPSVSRLDERARKYLGWGVTEDLPRLTDDDYAEPLRSQGMMMLPTANAGLRSKGDILGFFHRIVAAASLYKHDPRVQLLQQLPDLPQLQSIVRRTEMIRVPTWWKAADVEITGDTGWPYNTHLETTANIGGHTAGPGLGLGLRESRTKTVVLLFDKPMRTPGTTTTGTTGTRPAARNTESFCVGILGMGNDIRLHDVLLASARNASSVFRLLAKTTVFPETFPRGTPLPLIVQSTNVAISKPVVPPVVPAWDEVMGPAIRILNSRENTDRAGGGAYLNFFSALRPRADTNWVVGSWPHEEPSSYVIG